ncbi:hypothetical protein ZIOFF_035525 [Zingiber officinale]|uniref:Uncharacterized protein n=1 Tax=Zingiber officinale TaxID=94328 RepID=A0A8J5L0S9_ZINOF|nr:hypothetical protein ZIOFF_035525 [Zingiber officinale]
MDWSWSWSFWRSSSEMVAKAALPCCAPSLMGVVGADLFFCRECSSSMVFAFTGGALSSWQIPFSGFSLPCVWIFGSPLENVAAHQETRRMGDEHDGSSEGLRESFKQRRRGACARDSGEGEASILPWYVDPGFVCVDNVLGGFRVADLMQPLGLQIVLFPMRSMKLFIWFSIIGATNLLRTAIRFLAARFVWRVSTYEHDKGVAITCYVALHPNLRGVTGKYFDEELLIRLWDLSEKMLKSMSKEHSSQEDK